MAGENEYFVTLDEKELLREALTAVKSELETFKRLYKEEQTARYREARQAHEMFNQILDTN